MRFLSILLLALATALQAQTADRLQWGPFTSSPDSVTGIGIRGELSTKAGCVTRVTLDGEDVECATPTGTGAPVNANGPTISNLTATGTLAATGTVQIGSSGGMPYEPNGVLQLDRQGANALVIAAHGTAGFSVTYAGIQSAGTIASPAATLSGATIVSLVGYGHNGASYQTTFASASIRARTTSTWSGTNQGTFWTFEGVPDGSTTREEWVRLINGNLLLNTTTNNGQRLQVNGTSLFTGAATLQSTLAVTGASTFTGKVTGGDTIVATAGFRTPGVSRAARFQSGAGTSVFDTAQIDVLDVGEITGAGLFGDSLTVDSALVLANLSANSPLYLDGNNEVKTGTWSGTGTQVPTTQGATMNNLTATGTFTTPASITIAANTFTRSGAHNLTLTTGANTNVTLPASGTLATLSGVETLSNKTLTAPTLRGVTWADTLNVNYSVYVDGTGIFEDSVTSGLFKGTHRLVTVQMTDADLYVGPDVEMVQRNGTLSEVRYAVLYPPETYGPGRCILFTNTYTAIAYEWRIDPGAYQINGSTDDYAMVAPGQVLEICTSYSDLGVLDQWIIVRAQTP